MRTSRFAERGWLSWMDPDELSPKSMSQAVLAALAAEQPGSADGGPDLGGLSRAGQHLHLASLAARAAGGRPQSKRVSAALAG